MDVAVRGFLGFEFLDIAVYILEIYNDVLGGNRIASDTS